MPERRVLLDNFVLVKFILFLGDSDLLFITPNRDLFLTTDYPTTDVGKYWRGCFFQVLHEVRQHGEKL